MRVSVTVIAHNEEDFIEKCLYSVLHQSRPADEVIVIAHNCTDKTVQIAQQYPVQVVELHDSSGSMYSRAKAIALSTGDVVCCTDGDCVVDTDWVKNIVQPLEEHKSVSIVAGYTTIQNNLFWKFSSWWQFVINRKIRNRKAQRFAWGSNFAFRKKDYATVGGLEPLFVLKKELGLNYDAEDLYISLALQKVGSIFFALNARVRTTMPPEKASIKEQKNTIVPKQQEDNKKLFDYFDKV